MQRSLPSRGLSVDHVTVWRWVQHYAPILNQRLRRELPRPNRSWRADGLHVAGSFQWRLQTPTRNTQGNQLAR
jgi:transposase-like protein